MGHGPHTIGKIKKQIPSYTNFNYLSTLANLTLIILLSKMLKLKKKSFLPNQKISEKDNSEYLRNIPFVELKISKIN